MYDVAIIGGGPAAIFAAYEFVLKYPALKLVMLEAGNAIDKRYCPLAAKKVDHCINCKPCSIMRGFGGAGALVPITGFANSVAACAHGFKVEGQVFGIGARIFQIAGPVILYGILISAALGCAYWFVGTI